MSKKIQFEIVNIDPVHGVLVVDGLKVITGKMTEAMARKLLARKSRYVRIKADPESKPKKGRVDKLINKD